MNSEQENIIKNRYGLVRFFLNFMFGALVAVITIYGIPYIKTKYQSNTNNVSKKDYTQEELNQIFEMDKKTPDTKLYYSKALGVGFTYAPFNVEDDEGKVTMKIEPEVTELGYTITVSGYDREFPTTTSVDHTLEIFEKNINDTLDEAVKKEFLSKNNSKDCFILNSQETQKQSPFYSKDKYNIVQIGYTIKDDPSGQSAWDENLVKCPLKAQKYALTNGATLFFSEKSKSSKYGYLELGQDLGTASAGDKDNKDLFWFDTIKFLN